MNKKHFLLGTLILIGTTPSFAETTLNADHVVVTGARIEQAPHQMLNDVTVIPSQAIEKSGQSTLVELLQAQAGVEVVTNGGAGQPTSVFLRGANAGHSLVLIDGVRISSATLGLATFEHIPLSQVDHIEILRGPASSLYGADAIGGVIHIFTKSAYSKSAVSGFAGAGAYGTRRFDAGLQAAQNGTSFGLTLSSLTSHGFSAIAHQTGQNADDDRYRNFSASAHLSHRLNENHEIGSTLFYSDARNYSDPWQNVDDFGDTKLRSFNIISKNRFTANWTSRLRYGTTSDLSEIAGSDPQSYRTTHTEYLWQNDIGIGPGNLLLAVERLEQQVDTTRVFAVTRRTTNAVLAGYNGQIGNHLFQANYRTDNNSQYGRKNTGGISYGYQMTDAWRATAGYKTGFKAPTFNDLYYTDAWGSTGNPNLKPETAVSREMALRYSEGDHTFDFVAYRNNIKNLINWQTIGFASSPVNIGKSEIQGLTFSYSGEFSGLRVQASADLQSPLDEKTDNLLPRRARRHGSMQFGKTFGAIDVSSEIIASSERYNNVENTTRLGGYALLNLTVNYILLPEWRLESRWNNVLDKEYALSKDYAGENYNTPGSNLFVGIRWQPK